MGLTGVITPMAVDLWAPTSNWFLEPTLYMGSVTGGITLYLEDHPI